LDVLREALVDTAPVEALNLYLNDDRSSTGRPWVLLNMVASLDGGTAVDGRSSSLGDHDDLEVFNAVRAVPDVILVGSGTVKAEDYRPVSLDEKRRERRLERGMAATPTLAIVTGRLSVDPEARVFSDPDHKPLIITGVHADPTRLMMLGDAADVAILDDLSPVAILDHLGAAGVVLLEGGPTLNGDFARAGLIDEINLTITPTVLSGESRRIVVGEAMDPPMHMKVDRVLHGDESLFIRYVRKPISSTPG
jgi:riboflavin biosynthesis pyrimidine reductase